MAQDEFAQKHEELMIDNQDKKNPYTDVDMYLSRLPLTDQMTCPTEQYVCQVALLMNDSRKNPIVIEPRSGGSTREALNSTKSGILQSDSIL